MKSILSVVFPKSIDHRHSKIFLSIFLLACCMLLHKGTEAQTKNSLSQLTNTDSLYTQAQVSLSMSGDIPKALLLFNRVVTLQPNNSAAHAQLSNIYQHQGNYSKALEEIQKALKNDATNEDYLGQLGILQAQTGNYIETANTFNSLAKSTKNDPTDYYLKEAWAYNMAKKYQKALFVLNKVNLDDLDEKEPILMDKLKLYAHLEQVDSVLKTAYTLIKLNPKNPSYYVIAAFAEEKKENHQAVITLMDTAAKRFPDNPKVLQQVILTYDKYAPEKLNRFYDKLIADTAYSDQQKAILFYPLVDIRKKDSTANNILMKKLPQLAFKTPPNKYAILLYSGVISDENNFHQGIDVLKKGIRLCDNDLLLWNGLLNFELSNSFSTGKMDSLESYAHQAKKLFPESPVSYFYQAYVNYNHGDTSSCIHNLKIANSFNKKDSLIHNFSIYSFLGEIYQAQNNNDSAAVYLKKAIEINPYATMVLNNYSYLLAEQGRDLDSALAMSAKTLAAGPNESTFLDTYGWILYKQKKYAEAKTFIEKAILNTSKPDALIYEHLGDIENALGNHRKAKKNWKKSQDLGNNSLQLKEKLN